MPASGRVFLHETRTVTPSSSSRSRPPNNQKENVMNNISRTLSLCAVILLLTASLAAAVDRNAQHTSNMFAGPKANTGTVTHLYENGKSVLRVSQDFKVPDTPAPTWRIVDSKGAIYTLD